MAEAATDWRLSGGLYYRGSPLAPARCVKRLGPYAWMFPVGLITAVCTLVCWILFATISRAHPPACELHARVAWMFTTAAATTGICLPATFVEGKFATTVVPAACALAASGIAWWATTLLFPAFC